MNFLNNLKLRSKILMQTSVIGGAVLIIGILMVIILEQQKSTIEENLTQNLIRNKAIVSFTHVAKDISLDVIQVQQWLTDISATRGQDGLNDGFDEAENNAQKFKTDIETALKISRDLQLTSAIQVIKRVSVAFPPYYATGSKMAQSYIDAGPAGGNKMMSQFDSAAETINTEVAKLLDLADKELSKQDKMMFNNLDSISSSLTSVEVLNAVGVLIVLVIAAFSIVLIQKIVAKPLTGLNDLMLRLANGEEGLSLPHLDRVDEIGKMSEALHTFQHNLEENKKLEEENRIATEERQKSQREAQEREEAEIQKKRDQEQAESAKREAHNTRISELIKGFENSITNIMKTMVDSSNNMETTANKVMESSNNTKEHSSSVSVVSNDTANNVNMVAAAAEELSNSIQEIGRQATQANDISEEAVKEAQKSETSISALSQASAKINNVISIISDIADQTNLLALNATIESARAGEAGRGFAVVASEVKTLASQTSNATSEISLQITEIQSLTQEAVDSIHHIVEINNKSNETTTSIQAAIEQQNAATNEISVNIQRVAEGTSEVSSNISQVAEDAVETGNAGEEVSSVAKALGENTVMLQKEIEHFLDGVRKA